MLCSNRYPENTDESGTESKDQMRPGRLSQVTPVDGTQGCVRKVLMMVTREMVQVLGALKDALDIWFTACWTHVCSFLPGYELGRTRHFMSFVIPLYHTHEGTHPLHFTVP